MSVRIQRLELENFANLYAGIQIRTLEIDFSQQENTVCVIVGKNGTGKTSLLSYMTPFAGVGNLDARDSSALIIKGEKGRKKLVLYEYESGNTFVIQHFYLPSKDGHTVKSYISVNDTELNANGNVTSFKKLLYDYLGIEIDYLKLIRIGDNVSNLISSKSTERKVFMGKLLDEVDLYLRQYKRMSAKVSDTKAIVGRITDEISKTGISDESLAEVRLTELQKEEERLSKKLEEANDARSRIVYDIELLDFPEDGKSLILSLRKKVNKYGEALKNIPEGTSSKDLEAQLSDLETRRISLDHRKEELLNDIEGWNRRLDEVSNELQDVETEIEKEIETLNIRTMTEYLVDLRDRWNKERKLELLEVIVHVTKDEFDEFVVFLKSTQLILNGIYEFGKEPIREVLNRLRRDENITEFIQSSLVHLEAKHRKEKMSILDRLIDTYAGLEYSCSDGECPYKKLHRELLSIRDTTPVASVSKDESFYQAMKGAYTGLKEVLHSISERKAFIEKLPNPIQEFFLIDVMFDNIVEGRPIYDEEIVNSWMNFFTDRENLLALQDELSEQERKVKEVQAISRESYFRKREAELSKKKDELKDSLTGGLAQLENLDSDLDDLGESISTLNLQKEGLLSFEDMRSELDDLTTRESAYQEKQLELLSCNEKAQSIKDCMKKVREDFSLLSASLIRHRQLVTDLAEYTKKLDLYENIRYALSNRTGLPLSHINTYFWDTIHIANELLDIVYDGRIYLEEPEITENDFRIPYVKDGIEIADVISASQGEQSFFNMAISSALRAQCMERYNIALFDEVDAAFDDENRQKTIPVLTRQLEISKIRQAFLITHNQMFAKYPVDKIDLDDLSRSTISVNWS